MHTTSESSINAPYRSPVNPPSREETLKASKVIVMTHAPKAIRPAIPVKKKEIPSTTAPVRRKGI